MYQQSIVTFIKNIRIRIYNTIFCIYYSLIPKNCFMQNINLQYRWCFNKTKASFISALICFIVMVFVFSANVAKAQCPITVIFSSSPDASGNVAFTDMSSTVNTNKNWYWDFGDSTSSTAHNPTHAYAHDGSHHVTFTATSSNGMCSDSYDYYIYSVGAPNCSITALFTSSSDSSGNVYFTDITSVADTAWYWDFGDGNHSNERNPMHNYASNGSHHVTLTVYKSNLLCYDLYDTYVNSFACTFNALFSFYPDTSGNVYFTDLSSEADTAWHWDFGEGYQSNEKNPVHNFASNGFHHVSLTVQSKSSTCHDSYESNDVSSFACSFHTSFSSIPDSSGDVYFTDLSSEPDTGWYWLFDDGGYSNEKNPTHTFVDSGYHHVYFSSYNKDYTCGDTYENNNVYSYGIPIVTCNLTASFSHIADGDEITFTFTNNSSGDINNCHWYFGDGTESTDANPVHTYVGSHGYLTTYLFVYDNTGFCSDSTSETFYVHCNPDINPYFTYTADSIGTVIFTDSTIGADAYNYYWDFGDYKESFDQNPTHTYSKLGFHDIVLYVSDSNASCGKAYQETIYVPIKGGACLANYTYGVDSNGVVSFTNTSIGDVAHYYWNFGDGAYSYDENTTHSFSPGYYTVSLTVNDSSYTNSSIKAFDIHIEGNNGTGCFAKYSYYLSNATVGKISFTDESLGNASYWYWDFGDGGFNGYSYQQNPTHEYTNDGYYYVSLTTYDKNSGCSGWYGDYVYVSGFSSNNNSCYASFFSTIDTTSLAHFYNMSSGGGWANWDFGDGTYSYDWEPTHQYTSTGYFHVKLSFSSYYSGSATYETDIYVAGSFACKADFGSFIDSTGLAYFTDKTLGSVDKWYWNFGDGTYNASNYDENPIHQFDSSGYYQVSLSTYDSKSGCSSYYSDHIYIAGNSISCEADFSFFVDSIGEVFFKNKSLGTFTEYYWDFGDDQYSNSNLENPTFNYDKAGSYNVCLSVYDSISDCQASFCDLVTFADTSSSASLCAAKYTYYPDSTSNFIYFTDKSVGGANTWYWNFGDNTAASSSQNPSHQYADNGYYKVCETVSTTNGCQETFCDVLAVGDVTYSCYAEFSYYANKVTSTAHFKNLSKGNIKSYYWDFGDGNSSVQKNPTHTYADTGYYAVCITIYSDSCSNSYCDIIRVGNAVSNPCKFSCVWPGDANNDLEANHYDLLSIGLNYGETGPKRDSASIMWLGQHGEDWATWQENGSNNRHVDCNGDGVVNADDIIAIDSNFAFSHPTQMMKTQSGNDLHYEVLTSPIIPGGKVEIAIMAGDGNNISMYGLGWELGIDPTVVDMSTIQVNFANSWLGTVGSDLLTFDQTDNTTGKIFMSSVRNDQTMKTNQGEIARVSFTIDADANGEDISVELSTFGGINNSGDTVPFTSNGGDNVVITKIANNTFADARKINVYPNPTNNGKVGFSLPTIHDDAFEIKIYNSLSQVVYKEINHAGNLVKLDLSNLSMGMYSLSINSDKSGRFYQRFEIVK